MAKNIYKGKSASKKNTSKANKSTMSPQLKSALGKQGAPKSDRDAMKATNPNYSKGEEYKRNCQRCVYAYEMQRRGFDVEAMPRILNGNDAPAHDWQNIMQGQQWEKMPARGTKKAIESKMDNWGEGSRAILYLDWKNSNTAHVINVEKDKSGVFYVDAQSGHYKDIDSLLSKAIKGNTMISRVDNLEPTDKIIPYIKKKS